MLKDRKFVTTSAPSPERIMLFFAMAFLLMFSVSAGSACAQSDSTMPGTYGLKIYHINELLYPYVQVYFRTFDKNMQPLVNLNEMNIGLMVKGRPYDPMKRQYFYSVPPPATGSHPHGHCS